MSHTYSLSKFNSEGKLVKTVGGKVIGQDSLSKPAWGIGLSKDNKLFVTASVTGYKCLTLI